MAGRHAQFGGDFMTDALTQQPHPRHPNWKNLIWFSSSRCSHHTKSDNSSSVEPPALQHGHSTLSKTPQNIVTDSSWTSSPTSKHHPIVLGVVGWPCSGNDPVGNLASVLGTTRLPRLERTRTSSSALVALTFTPPCWPQMMVGVDTSPAHGGLLRTT